MGKVIVCVVGALLLVGCTSASDVSVSPIAPTTTTVAPESAGGADVTHFDVDSLGLGFSLPSSFQTAQDSDLLFVGRSLEPQALFTVDRESPDAVNHEPEDGETLTVMTIDGLVAIVVNDAVVAGLPAGIASVELLVANGPRSFSVIMSAAEPELDALWQVFLGSISIRPA